MSYSLKTVAQLINWTTEYNLWAQFQVPVTLALGMINQCVGKFSDAWDYYRTVEKVNNELMTQNKNSNVTYACYNVPFLDSRIGICQNARQN